MKSIVAAAAVIFAATTGAALGQEPAANPKPPMPAIATSSTPAPTAPAAGRNSFTMAQAKSRIEKAGYTNVSGLAKDRDGVWRGTASKAGASADVSLDYQGNVLPK